MTDTNPPTLIDVSPPLISPRSEHRRQLAHLGIAAIIGLAAGFGLMVWLNNIEWSARYPPLIVLVGVTGCVVPVIIVIIAARQNLWRSAVEMLDTTPPPTNEHLAEILKLSFKHFIGVDTESFVNELMDRRRLGLVFRLASAPRLPPINPLLATFEPCPISELDPGFAALRFGPGEYGKLVSRAAFKPSRLPVWLQYLSGAMTIGALAWVLIPSVVARLPFAARISLMLGPLLLLGNSLLGSFVVNRAQPSRGWYVAPGCLIVKKLGGLHQFVNSWSNLVLQPFSKDGWSVFVTDRATQSRCQLTNEEAHIVLRAWLTPLPPPTPDQLQFYFSAPLN